MFCKVFFMIPRMTYLSVCVMWYLGKLVELSVTEFAVSLSVIGMTSMGRPKHNLVCLKPQRIYDLR